MRILSIGALQLWNARKARLFLNQPEIWLVIASALATILLARILRIV